MRIVPSGTKRTVTAQQAKPGNPPPREGIQQEDITPAAKPAEGGDFNPMAKFDNTLQQQQKPTAKPAVPDQESLNKDIGGGEDSPDLAGKIGPQCMQSREDPNKLLIRNMQNIKEFKLEFIQFVQQFNINVQLITRDPKKKKMLDKLLKISPTTGKGRIEIPGWWIGPDGTRHDIDYTEAYQSLKGLANNHDLEVVPTEMGMGDDVYIFDVNPLSASAEVTPALNGMEQAYGLAGGSGSDGEQRKAAESRHSFIKESHSQIIASLIKSGFGGMK